MLRRSTIVFVLLVALLAITVPAFASGNHDKYLGSFTAHACGDEVTFINVHSVRNGTNGELVGEKGTIVAEDIEAYENKHTTVRIPKSWAGQVVEVWARGKNSVKWEDVEISCPNEPEIPEIPSEERDPAGGLVCVTYTDLELLPARYAQYRDTSGNWVSWDGWVLSVFKPEIGLWELSLRAHRGAMGFGNFLISYESGLKTMEVYAPESGGDCQIVNPDPTDPVDNDPADTCPECGNLPHQDEVLVEYTRRNGGIGMGMTAWVCDWECDGRQLIVLTEKFTVHYGYRANEILQPREFKNAKGTYYVYFGEWLYESYYITMEDGSIENMITLHRAGVMDYGPCVLTPDSVNPWQWDGTNFVLFPGQSPNEVSAHINALNWTPDTTVAEMFTAFRQA